MTQFGQRIMLTVSLAAALTIPTATVQAEPDREIGFVRVSLEKIEDWLSGYLRWYAGAGIHGEPNGEPVVQEPGAQDPSIEEAAEGSHSEAGVHGEPNG